MKTLALLFTLASAALAQESFPIYEKDPWQAFGAGSSVKYKRGSAEHSIKVKSVDKDGRTLERSPVEEDEEAEYPYRFVPFSDLLKSDASGLKLTGKGTQTVRVGTRNVKAKVEEYSWKDSTDGAPIRLVSSPDVPGGVVRYALEIETGEERLKVEYEFKGLEKLKVGGKPVECARFDLKLTKKSEDLKQEGSVWLSETVPGMLVKSEIKSTRGKAASVETIEAVDYTVGK